MSFTTTDANVRISVEEAKHGNGFCTAADLLRYRLYDSYLSLIKVAAAGTLPSRDSKSSMSISESESEDNTHNGRRGKHRHTPLRQRSRSPNTRSPRKNACSPKERYDPAYPTTPEEAVPLSIAMLRSYSSSSVDNETDTTSKDSQTHEE